MEIQETGIARRLRLAAILIALGLFVELFTLAWNNPIAFLVFLGLGGIFILAGIVIYLLSLVSGDRGSRASVRSMTENASH